MKKVLVFGSTGGLGTVVCKYLAEKGFSVTGVAFRACPSAQENVLLTRGGSLDTQFNQVKAVISNCKYCAIINVAGGWAGGNLASDTLFTAVTGMQEQSVVSAVLTAKVASQNLMDGGLLVFTGSSPCLSGTSGMIGYGMAKAAVHHLTKSLADPAAAGLPVGACTVCIMPDTIDTPMNRKGMPNADFSKWTKSEDISALLDGWIEGKSRPQSGSLLAISTSNGKMNVESK